MLYHVFNASFGLHGKHGFANKQLALNSKALNCTEWFCAGKRLDVYDSRHVICFDSSIVCSSAVPFTSIFVCSFKIGRMGAVLEGKPGTCCQLMSCSPDGYVKLIAISSMVFHSWKDLVFQIEFYHCAQVGLISKY